MGFSEFLGNERIVAALRGALRSDRVPHALLFSGPRGLGKYTLARMFAQAANCERLKDDFCGECETCKRIALLADPEKLIEQGLAERGESADAATVERVPLDPPNASGRLGAGARPCPPEKSRRATHAAHRPAPRRSARRVLPADGHDAESLFWMARKPCTGTSRTYS